MTAPLTPPHRPSNEPPGDLPRDTVPNDDMRHDGVPGTPHGGTPGTPGAPGEPGTPHGGPAWPPRRPFTEDALGDETHDTAAEVRQGALVTGAVALLGVALGLLWLWLAPRIPLVSDGRAVFLENTEGEGAVGADGVFTLIALVCGAVSAAAVFLLRRHGGIGVVLGLALGGLLGSVIGWGIGTLLGPTHDVVAHARAVGEGVTFEAPLELNAYGALLAWPVAAMVVHLALTALFGPRDPEPDWDLGPFGPPPPPPGDARP
ncbi:DUF2567 domain-containing protein [Streptomyces sp. NPDC047928]|uniref:DUF2567 domain-containing protein n=1 Tax=unclassified Streptomyces TaxID=2593676 RepID=UPI003718CB54